MGFIIMNLYQLILSAGQQANLSNTLPNQYVQLVSGTLTVNGIELAAGDGLKITDEDNLVFKSVADELVKALVFELP